MRRLWTRSLLVTALAGTALIGAGVVLGPLHQREPAATPAQASAAGTLDAFVARTTAHLQTVPGDWQSWAALGMAQIQLARITYDPAHYPLAETALRRSLTVKPAANAAALTGLGALAAAKHDFRTALTYARKAVAADSYAADAYGVLTDAYVELGRYPEATTAVQRMLNLRPDVGSYSRASYLYELRGDIPQATKLMKRAYDVASDPSDYTFTLLHLGELAFGSGDFGSASAYFAEGLRRQPGQAALLADRAKIAAAQGDLPSALNDLRAATSTLPTVDHLMTLSDVQRAAGDTAAASRTDDLIRVSTRLPGATPAATDIDLILFYADRGAPAQTGADHADAAQAVSKGRALLAARPSVSVEIAYAWALHAAGRDREALQHADRGLRLGTRDARGYYYRGMIKQALRDRSGARTDLTEALKINPDFSIRYAPTARAALKSLGSPA